MRGLQIFFAAAAGNGRGQHERVGLRGLAHIADRNLVVAIQQIGEALGRVLHILGDDEGDGAGVAQRPMAFLILGPGRDLVPIGGLVGLLRPFLAAIGPNSRPTSPMSALALAFSASNLASSSALLMSVSVWVTPYFS